MKNGNRSFALLVPLAIVGGWAAGAVTAKLIVRREIGRLRELIKDRSLAVAAQKDGVAAGEGAGAAREGTGAARESAGAAQEGAGAEARNGAATARERSAEIPDETLMVLSAAVAAFLGKRARLRAVRLVRTGTSPWAQEGRVSIQASHILPRM